MKQGIIDTPYRFTGGEMDGDVNRCLRVLGDLKGIFADEVAFEQWTRLWRLTVWLL